MSTYTSFWNEKQFLLEYGIHGNKQKAEIDLALAAIKIKKSPFNPNLKTLFYITYKRNLEALLCSFELRQDSILKKIQFYDFISTNFFCLCLKWYLCLILCGGLPDIYRRHLAVLLCITSVISHTRVHIVWFLRMFCTGPGVGLLWPLWSFPAEDSLWF